MKHVVASIIAAIISCNSDVRGEDPFVATMELRKRVVQTLNVPMLSYERFEKPEDGVDRGLKFLRESVADLYRLGTTREEIRRRIDNITEKTKSLPEPKVYESEHVITVRVSFAFKSDATGDIRMKVANIGFYFDSDNRLKRSYYVEVERSADAKERAAALEEWRSH